MRFRCLGRNLCLLSFRVLAAMFFFFCFFIVCWLLIVSCLFFVVAFIHLFSCIFASSEYLGEASCVVSIWSFFSCSFWRVDVPEANVSVGVMTMRNKWSLCRSRYDFDGNSFQLSPVARKFLVCDLQGRRINFANSKTLVGRCRDRPSSASPLTFPNAKN